MRNDRGTDRAMRHPRLSRYLFCYGTLMFPALFAAVCGRRLPCDAAMLKGHARHRVCGEVFPGVVAAPEAEVRGVLYAGVGPRSLGRLDRYEADYYERRLLRVRDGAGRPRMAWVYVVPERHRDRLVDAPWDVHQFRRRHLERYLRRLSG